MGTTDTYLKENDSIEIAWTCCVEGYPFILTDGTPTQATDAWSATNWNSALSGLSITCTFKQSFSPWSNELPVAHATFHVMPDNTAGATADQFGIDMFKCKPSIRSELTVGFESDADVSGFNITVRDADQFSTGTVHIGTQTFNVTSAPSGFTIPVPAGGQGYLAPFGNDTGSANTFPGASNLPPDEGMNHYTTNAPIMVTDSPVTWIGKKVAIYCHRVVNGVFDVVAQARLVFAGTIDRVTDQGDGGTSVDCIGIQQQILDAVVMENQWSARIKPGMMFTDGMRYKVSLDRSEIDAAASPPTKAPFIDKKHQLVCITGATGNHQFEPGRYTAEEILSLLGNSCQQSNQFGTAATPPFDYEWGITLTSESSGSRARLEARHTSGNAEVRIRIGATHNIMLDLLGFTSNSDKAEGEFRHSAWSQGLSDDNLGRLDSPEPPLRNMPLTRLTDESEHYHPSLKLEKSEGTFHDHTAELPPEAQESIESGQTWSYFSLGDDIVFLGRKTDATSITQMRLGVGIAKLQDKDQKYLYQGTRYGDPEPLIKQIWYSADTFTNQVTKLLASTDGKGINHATYDVLPIGGAGVPWDLLGDSWLNSCKNLEQSTLEDSLVLVVEKPTRIWDLIKTDFAVRMAQIVWKDSVLQCAQLTVPNAETSDATVLETSKSDEKRTTSAQYTDWLCNTLKLSFNRDIIEDKYTDVRIVRDLVGYESMGQLAKTKTIELRNTFDSEINSGASIESLGEMLASRFMPILSRPLRIWRTAVNHRLWHLAPGDTVTFSDDWIRNPTTGTRGVTSRACTVLDINYTYGVSSRQSYMGELTLIFTEEDRAFTMAPCALQNEDYSAGSYSNGWDSVNKRLAVEVREYARSDEDADVLSFNSGDAVRITEVDPADPSAADSFSDVLTGRAVGAPNYVELTSGFGVGGRPTFSSSKLYRVTADKYSVVNAGANADAQVIDTFQADSGDGFIEDLVDPNLYADNQDTTGFDVAAATSLPSRHADDSFDEGASVHPGIIQDLCRMANNLANYKCASHNSFHGWNGISADFAGVTSTNYASSAVGQLLDFFPLFIGKHRFPGNYTRKLNVQPIIAYEGAGTATINVVTSQYPQVPTLENVTGLGRYIYDPVFRGVSKLLTFTSTHDGSGSPNTWDYPTLQQVTPVRGAYDKNITWISIYSNTGANHKYMGFAQLWLGPLE